ncbi:MAG: D-tyrosyl-tRNA(Tyr) deacylase [Deltaproteobacteria bacterium]|nr:D-tyrosyl-tRNA(Tyr) deacylase [Deltaproteobacteria bacterium]
MRAVVQRVSRARVTVGEEEVGAIGTGLVVLLGAGEGDSDRDVDYLARKIVGLRVFEDAAGQMNESLQEVGGALLVVSQFTLYGDCRKGRRPSFVKALEPGEAERLVDRFVLRCREEGAEVATGRFRTTMNVDLCNAGPVTLMLDSQKAF